MQARLRALFLASLGVLGALPAHMIAARLHTRPHTVRRAPPTLTRPRAPHPAARTLPPGGRALPHACSRPASPPPVAVRSSAQRPLPWSLPARPAPEARTRPAPSLYPARRSPNRSLSLSLSLSRTWPWL